MPEIGKDYIIRDGRLIWLTKYTKWDGSRWVSAEERNAAILAQGPAIISWEAWTGADQIIEGIPS